VAKVNVHENFDLATEYGVMSIPRVFIFNKNRKPVHEIKGLVPESQLVKALNQILGV